MTSLGRWLVGILNAHIERHNVPDVHPDLAHKGNPAPDSPLARFYIGQLDEAVTAAQRDSDIADAMRAEIDRQRQVVVEGQRLCWACGDPSGFHAAHDCDTHFDTTGGAARRPMPMPAPPPIQLPVGIDYGFPSASTWRRT